MLKLDIDTLYFDAYGTLFDVESVSRAVRKIWPDSAQELTALWRTKQLEYTWLRSLMGRYRDFSTVTKEALMYSCRKLNLACKPEQAKIMLEAYNHLSTFAEVSGALEQLKQRVTLGILSNGTPTMLSSAVSSAGLEGFFSHLLSADEVKTYKPDPRIYQLVCQRTGLAKEKIGFVSANGFDVAGAKSFGFRVIWVNRSAATEDELEYEPDFILRDLSGLAALV